MTRKPVSKKESNGNAILLISCPDRKGLVAAVAEFIHSHNGNIVHAEQHTDHEEGMFFQRVEWQLDDFSIPPEEIGSSFAGTARRFQMKWRLHFSRLAMRVAIFVSRYDHCLHDLLWRNRAGELPGKIVLIISNHSDARDLAESFGIEFKLFPITPENKLQQEEKEMALLQENRVDLIVLARYMQILTSRFVRAYPNQIINIHHSFLPAFKGGSPYVQAHQRGVKVIGATSHYVTEEIDEGPIIDQEVRRVSHRDSVEDLIRKGRDVEKVALARAVRLHLLHKILPYGQKTVIFD